MLRARQIALNGAAFCSMGMFDSWAGQPLDGGGGKDNQQIDDKNKDQNADVAGGGKDGKQKNDTTNDGPVVDDIWKAVKDDTSGGDKSDKNKNTNDNTNADQRTQEQKVADYLKGQKLDPIVLSDQDKEALKNGDFENVLAQINAKVATSHISAVNAANALIADKLPKMVDEAVNKSRQYVDGMDLRKFLQNDPALKNLATNPLFAPMLEGIFKQFLDKGATREQAAKGTKQYFDRMRDTHDPNASGDRNRGGPFRTPQNSGETDWLEVLGAKKA